MRANKSIESARTAADGRYCLNTTNDFLKKDDHSDLTKNVGD
jgi:hypothetical protein